jgi:hypothetical protein
MRSDFNGQLSQIRTELTDQSSRIDVIHATMESRFSGFSDERADDAEISRSGDGRSCEPIMSQFAQDKGIDLSPCRQLRFKRKLRKRKKSILSAWQTVPQQSLKFLLPLSKHSPLQQPIFTETVVLRQHLRSRLLRPWALIEGSRTTTLFAQRFHTPAFPRDTEGLQASHHTGQKSDAGKRRISTPRRETRTL